VKKAGSSPRASLLGSSRPTTYGTHTHTCFVWQLWLKTSKVVSPECFCLVRRRDKLPSLCWILRRNVTILSPSLPAKPLSRADRSFPPIISASSCFFPLFLVVVLYHDTHFATDLPLSARVCPTDSFGAVDTRESPSPEKNRKIKATAREIGQ
jgi:hypothetical protein